MEADQVQRALQVHSEQAEEFAARYANADPYRSCFAYSRMRLDRMLDSYVPPTSRAAKLLDVGCGTGHQMASWRERGYRVSGVDGSRAMLDHAHRRNPSAELHLADARRLPFSSAVFDVVTALEVLRYLPDPISTIREMARVLAPGGTCLATAAPVFSLNGYPLVNRLALALPLRLTRLRQYFTTTRHLRRQFTEAGFRDIQVHGVYIGPLIWVERLAPRALPRILKSWERIDARLADRWLLRDLGNMYLVRAVRDG